MRVLTIVHEDDAGPGVFGDVLARADAEVESWLVAERPEPPAAADAYDAIISFGGSVHPSDEAQHPWLASEKRLLGEALQLHVPVLGVCLGAELIAAADGPRPQRLKHPEIGWYEVSLTAAGAADPVLGAAGPRFMALEWHSYAVQLPARATELARGANCLQAYRVGKHAWGIQFHAEVTAAGFQYWLDHYTDDEDAMREGIDTEAIARETEQRIGAWQERGRGICERFLVVAAAAR